MASRDGDDDGGGGGGNGLGVELEHLVGCATGMRDGIHVLRGLPGYVVFPAGGSVVVASVTDPHDQTQLRGADTTSRVSALAVSNDGRRIAMGYGGPDMDAYVFHRVSGGGWTEVFKLEEHDDEVTTLHFSHDDRLLASASAEGDAKLILWDISTGKIVLRIVSPAAVPGVRLAWASRLSASGHYRFATAARRQHLVLWELDPFTGEAEREDVTVGSRSGVRDYLSVAFSSDASVLYAGTASGDVICASTTSGRIQGLFRACRIGVTTLLVQRDSEDGADVLVLGSGNGCVSVWKRTVDAYGRLAEFAPVVRVEPLLNELRSSVSSVSLLHRDDQEGDDSCRAFVASSLGMVKCVSLRDGAGWSSRGGSAFVLTEAHAGAVVDLASDGLSSQHVATAGEDRTLRIWDLEDYSASGKILVRDAGSPSSLLLSQHSVLSGWNDGCIRCHGRETEELEWILDGGSGGVSTLELCSGGSVEASGNELLLSGCDTGMVAVWRLSTRRLMSQLSEHRDRVVQALAHSDATRVFTCSVESGTLLWDLQHERLLRRFTLSHSGSNGVALGGSASSSSSDGAVVVVSAGQDGSVYLWDERVASPVGVIRNVHRGGCTAVTTTAVATTTILASGGHDAVVKLWDLRAGEPLSVEAEAGVIAAAHSGRVTRLVFTPDARQLVSIANDGCLCVWNIFPPEQ